MMSNEVKYFWKHELNYGSSREINYGKMMEMQVIIIRNEQGSIFSDQKWKREVCPKFSTIGTKTNRPAKY